jgi:hypothetical protein
MAYQKSIHFTELRNWLTTRGLSGRKFARDNGIENMKLSRLLNGRLSQFDFDLIDRVARGTDGEIGVAQFAAFAERLITNGRRAA